MSKPNKIKWRDKDKAKLNKLVKNFNAKVSRLIKKGAIAVPNRISVKDLKNNIINRKDFNNTVNRFSRFLKKGAEEPKQNKEGLLKTKWEFNELSILVRAINIKRKNERKNKDISSFKGNMGSLESNNLNKKQLNIENLKPEDWERYVKSAEKQFRSDYNDNKIKTYKDNYMQAVINNLGGGYYATKLLALVKSLNAVEMYSAYYDDPVLQINFTSDPLQGEIIAELAYNRWLEYIG